jgi:antitoxin (DNA-binding transcriptional repressor) of toxin-antitoxin stability system
MVMIVVNIAEAKANLSQYLDALARGERVIIAKWNRPVAELKAIAAARTEPRPIGGAAGAVTVPPSFFEALPDELLRAFEGSSQPVRAADAAEQPSPTYARPRTRKPRRGDR